MDGSSCKRQRETERARGRGSGEGGTEIGGEKVQDFIGGRREKEERDG